MRIKYRDIKARINRIRLDKNLKQLEFADSIGLSQSGYSTMMGRDGTSQRLKTLALAIEAVYGFRHEWILHGEEPKQQGNQKHLDPLERLQLDILGQDGIAPELKAESLKMMVSNNAHGVLLGMMMISLRHSRNIQNSGVPKNILEKYEDKDLIWRKHANQKLKKEYKKIFAMIDHFIFMKIPNFNVVYEWRLLQESKLRKKSHSSKKIMSYNEIKRFIMFYERITLQMIKDLSKSASVVIFLKTNHKIKKILFRL